MRNLCVVFLFAGCLGKAPARLASPTKADDPTPTMASADQATQPTMVFNHDDDDLSDPFAVLARLESEGPPELSERLHSCSKMKIATLTHMLSDFGVDLSATALMTSSSAASVLSAGQGALGAAVFAQRVAETLNVSSATAVKMFDIFVQAAPEIIAQMPTSTRCMNAGQPTAMFDSAGTCTLDGLSCLKGAPAKMSDKALCDEILAKGSITLVAGTQVSVAQAMAVGVQLAAAHTCE